MAEISGADRQPVSFADDQDNLQASNGWELVWPFRPTAAVNTGPSACGVEPWSLNQTPAAPVIRAEACASSACLSFLAALVWFLGDSRNLCHRHYLGRAESDPLLCAATTKSFSVPHSPTDGRGKCF